MKVIALKTFIKGEEESTEGPIQIYGYGFRCPGCGDLHIVNINPKYHSTCWGFNGNVESPTFTPSLLCRSGHYVTGQNPSECYPCSRGNKEVCYVCHSFITDGKIQFLGDCTHKLAGQTVLLFDVETEKYQD